MIHNIIQAIVAFQALTFVALSILFYTQGNWRLASAQLAYAFTTVIIFGLL